MAMKKLSLNLLFIMLMSAQVNTEVYRDSQKDSGFVSITSGNLSISSGNSEYSKYKLNQSFSYKSQLLNSFFILSAKRGEASGKEFQDQSFAHLRSTYSFRSDHAVEAFAQIEYNDFINLNSRSLAGAYYRYRLYHSTNDNHIFLGIGLMKEVEEFGSQEIEFDLWRSTNYLTIRYKIADHLSLLSVTYVQFDTGNTSDYRILNNSSLNTPISKFVTFKTELDFRYDSLPFENIESKDLDISFGLTVKF